MPESKWRFIGGSGFCVRAVGPGSCAQLLCPMVVERAQQAEMRTIPRCLTVPTAVWHQTKTGMRLAGVECIEHFAFGHDGTEALRQSGWNQIAAAILSKARNSGNQSFIPRALTAHMNKGKGHSLQSCLGSNAPQIAAVRASTPTLVPTAKPKAHCCMMRCGQEPAPHGVFCARHSTDSVAHINFGDLDPEMLGVEARHTQYYNWVIKPLRVQHRGRATAAALYFGAEHADIEVLQRLGLYLQSGLGVDELVRVAAGCRPVKATELKTWATVFGRLGNHAVLHAMNAALIVNGGSNLTSQHAESVATLLAVYGIATMHFVVNDVSAVTSAKNGAWAWVNAVAMGAFAEGAVIWLPSGYALYTAVYAAAVLIGAMAHSFTYALVEPGLQPHKSRKFGHVMSGWGLTAEDYNAMERLADSDTCLITSAGMLSWSALFRIVTGCRATVVFQGSPHFAQGVVYCDRIQRHVGGPFALIHRAAIMTDRLDQGKTQVDIEWTDLAQALGPERSGLCAKCGNDHIAALYAGHSAQAKLAPCAEAALTNGATVAKLQVSTATYVGHLITAAQQLSR